MLFSSIVLSFLHSVTSKGAQLHSRRMTSSTSVQDVRAIQHGGKPEWLDLLLMRTFFGSCAIHEPPKNMLNNYCIDCNLSACGHCIGVGSHAEHRVLKLYRHVYKDVVLLDQMRKHIDCTNIQAYRSNKQLVICLHPLPHSGKCTREEAACETCTRVLLNPNANRYCSIECKVKAFLKSQMTWILHFLLSIAHPHQSQKPSDLGKGYLTGLPFNEI